MLRSMLILLLLIMAVWCHMLALSYEYLLLIMRTSTMTFDWTSVDWQLYWCRTEGTITERRWATYHISAG